VIGKKFNLTTSKVAHIESKVDSACTRRLVADVKRTASIPGDRLVIIDTPGGSMREGDDMMTTLKAEQMLTGGRIVCVVKGSASSMGFNILSQCDVRLGTKKSRYMFHDLFFEREVLYEYSRIRMEDLQSLLTELLKENARFYVLNAAAMNMSTDDLIKISSTRPETYWVPGTLLSRGYLTDIVELLEE
jgi:ATP-dependent protease ClpP protease subunit